MAGDPDADRRDGAAGSIDEMMQHLEEAKQRDPSDTGRGRSATSALQRAIQRRTDVAVLASNHESRLEELVANDTVTHRSGKKWVSAEVGVEAHGRLPIYYRLDGSVQYTGYISRIVLEPDGDSEGIEEFLEHITDDDTYAEYHETLDTTTYLVTDGQRLDEPFSQSELEKLSGDGSIDEEYSYQPAYVRQRPGDFPDFP